MAERHIREGEALIARQLAVVEELDRDNHPEAAAKGRVLLATLLQTIGLMREHLRLEQSMARAGTRLLGRDPEN